MKKLLPILFSFFLLATFVLFSPSSANASYSLDPSFGSAGVARTDIGMTSQRFFAVQPDGKIVVAGTTSSGSQFVIARYDTNGSLDTTFGNNGLFTQNLGDTSSANGVAIQSDGKIFFVGAYQLLGTSWGSSILTGRLNANGTPDTTYGTNGFVTTTVNGYFLAHPTTHPLIQSDGKYIIIGTVAAGPSQDVPYIARYNTDGSLDQAFGNGGMTIYPSNGTFNFVDTATFQSDGKILLAAQIASQFAVIRYNTNGSYDQTFGNNGVVIGNFGNGSQALDVAEQSDGKLIAVGVNSSSGIVVRFNPDGSLDTNFANSGIYNPNWNVAYNLFIQPTDGKIVFGGMINTSDWSFSRLNPDGTLDASFGTNGLIDINVPDAPTAYQLFDNNGKLLVGSGDINNKLVLGQLVSNTVSNTSPSVGSVTISPNPVQTNTAVTATTTFTDPDAGQTHTATINWDVQGSTISTNNCQVIEPNGTTPGSVNCTFTNGYASANVYQAAITVSDGTASSISPITYVSVYNPVQGSVFSAGSKFTSPVGAYLANPTLTGNVKFGLNYRYSGTMPVGNRSFTLDFNAANLHFNAKTVNTLVIANQFAMIMGSGTDSGNGQTYTYLVTGDGTANVVRIQLKDQSGNVVYDTQPGAANNAAPTLPVQNVVVH